MSDAEKPSSGAPTLAADFVLRPTAAITQARLFAASLKGQTWALLAVSFAAPVILALLFFRTPGIDAREHINWGLNFPFTTWKHPPLQSWLNGLVALTGARDNWAFALAAQAYNFLGLYYAVRLARDFIDRDAAPVAAVAFCGTLFTLLYPVTASLNADQAQIPLWLAVVYHALRAARDDRRRDWIALGLFAAAALYAKYFAAALLIGVAAGFLWSPQHRASLLRPGPYVAAAICLTLVVPQVVLTFMRPENFSYDLTYIDPGGGLEARAFSVFQFVLGLAFAVPFLAVAAVGAWRGEWERRELGADARLIVFVTLVAMLVALAMVPLFGMHYRFRFNAPIVPLALVAMLALLRVREGTVPAFVRRGLQANALMLVGGIIYIGIVGDHRLREPANAAAAQMRRQWEQTFPCGPAYVLGDKLSAHAVGLYFGAGVQGASAEDFARSRWIDPKRARDYGAVIVEGLGPIPPGAFAAIGFDPAAAAMTLALPERGFGPAGTQIYRYWFVAPHSCAGVPVDLAPRPVGDEAFEG